MSLFSVQAVNVKIKCHTVSVLFFLFVCYMSESVGLFTDQRFASQMGEQTDNEQ